jgi:hypothetical protein
VEGDKVKSYELIATSHTPDTVEQVRRVVNKLHFLGLVIINAQPGRTPSIRVQPNAATRLLASVYTGQGGEAGQMYRSYAAVIDGVKIVWHKPMRAPEASKVVRWPGQGYRRAAR